MSTDNITELLTQVAVRANALCQSVQDHAGNINATVNAKKAELNVAKQQAQQDIQNYIAGARGEQSHILLSRNQQMEPLGSGAIKGFNTIGLTSFEVTKEATIYANPGTNDTEHTDAGVAQNFRSNVYDGYVNGPFHILRIKWTRDPEKTARLDDNFSNGYHQGALTTGCYLKVISGSVGGAMWPVTQFGDGWQLLGTRQKVNNQGGAFVAPHAKLLLSSLTGEALICLFGTVSGYANLEANAWGRFAEFARPSDIDGLNTRLSNLEAPPA